MKRCGRIVAALGLLAALSSAQVGADAGTRKPSVRAGADAGVARKSSARGAAEVGSASKLGGSTGPSAEAAGKASTRHPDAGPASRSSESAEQEIGAVLAQFAQTEALSARFREEKRMSLLAQPLASEGVLYYEKPRSLARHTERPRKSSLLLEKELLTFGDAQHSESIGLSAQPALRVLVETFVSVLAGDRVALERVADVAVEATEGGGFRIRVTPRDAGLKRLVRTMAFEGKGALLTRMELLDANDDSTVTTFSDVKLRQRFSTAERARLFRIGG